MPQRRKWSRDRTEIQKQRRISEGEGDATCLCVLVLYFVLENWRVADDMPLYIKAPAINCSTGPDETWCQRFPCKTMQFQHTIVHKYNPLSSPKIPVSCSQPNPISIRTTISIMYINISPYEY
jgi:hypothetical protein